MSCVIKIKSFPSFMMGTSASYHPNFNVQTWAPSKKAQISVWREQQAWIPWNPCKNGRIKSLFVPLDEGWKSSEKRKEIMQTREEASMEVVKELPESRADHGKKLSNVKLIAASLWGFSASFIVSPASGPSAQKIHAPRTTGWSIL